MKIFDKKLNEIKPYEKNPRKNDASVPLVAKSIEEFGFKVPIVIDKDGTIVCGHTRYKAAKRLNLETVPCIVADDLTEAQIKAFRLADNKVGDASEWDMPLLSEELADLGEFDMTDLGFEDTDLEDPEIDNILEDSFDDKPRDHNEPTRVHRGDVWILGKHRLMCGDSTNAADIEKLMNGEQAKLLLTDPPYGVDYEDKARGTNKERKRDTIKNDGLAGTDFDIFLNNAFSAVSPALTNGGSFYVWHASATVVSFISALHNCGMTVREQLIWNKSSFVLGRQDYQHKHEPCLYGWKDGAAHYFIDNRRQATVIDETNVDAMGIEALRAFTKQLLEGNREITVLNEKKPQSSGLHPTMKPVALFARLIRNSTKKDQLVLDPFGGSGTTIIAAEQLGRACYMMEYEPYYCDVIIDRWEKLTGREAKKNAD